MAWICAGVAGAVVGSAAGGAGAWAMAWPGKAKAEAKSKMAMVTVAGGSGMRALSGPMVKKHGRGGPVPLLPTPGELAWTLSARPEGSRRIDARRGTGPVVL